MRTISLFLLIATLSGLPLAVLAKPASSKESVTTAMNADLLKYARTQNIARPFIVKNPLDAQLKESTKSTSGSHLAFLTSAFNNFEALLLAPLNVTEKTPTSEVRVVCQIINKKIARLVADAGTRKSMPLPTSLHEARKLDELLQRRFQDLQSRFNQVADKMRISGKIMEAECADIEKDNNGMQEAMKTTFAGYGPVGWCQAMKQKPKTQWTKNDAETFTKFCASVIPD